MTNEGEIDSEAVTKHRMPLRAAQASHLLPSLRPACVDDFFSADAGLAAVSIEYIVDPEDGIPTAALPVTFWEQDQGKADVYCFSNMTAELLRTVTNATASVESGRHLRSIPVIVRDEARPIMTERSFTFLLVIYLRDVTFMMQADIGENIQEIDGETWADENQLATLMERIVGQAWYVPEDSQHAHISQLARVREQVKTFDAIFHQQTGMTIDTIADPNFNIA